MRKYKDLIFDNIYRFSGIAYPNSMQACMSQQSSWRARLMSEYHTADMSLNVTLTHDDEHLKTEPCLKDLQDFWKRLRRYFSYHYANSVSFKYFVVSEFGDKFGRLHYHVIIFLYKKGNVTLPYYEISDAIEKKWYNGFTHVRRMSPRHVYYNTKYIQKKFLEEHIKCQSQGLGLDYLRSIKDFLLVHDFSFSLYGHKFRLPRDCRKQIYSPEELLAIRARYTAKSLIKHKELIDKQTYVDTQMHYSTAVRTYDFLLTYYAIPSNEADILQSFEVVSFKDQHFVSTSNRPLYTIRWHGIFALYFTAQMDMRNKFVQLKNNIT